MSKLIKIILSIQALLLILLCFINCENQEPGRYYDEYNKFSIIFPTNWEITKEDFGITITALSPQSNEEDLLFESISVSVEEFPVEITLEEYFEELNKIAENEFINYHIVNSGDTLLNKIPAKWILYHYKDKDTGEQVTLLGYCLVRTELGYTITCNADSSQFEDYKNTFKKAIRSFRFE